MVTKEIIKTWMLENDGTILKDPVNPGVFTGYVTFTPKRAASALENNTRNRPMATKGQVPVLKEVMENGLWNANVSKINFEDSGVLSDGQNRLFACVESNVSFRVLVTWGVDRTAQLVTDRRGARKMADDLAIDGIKGSTNLAAATRVIYMREVKGLDVYQIVNNGQFMSGVSDILLYNYFSSNSEMIEDAFHMMDRIYASVRYLKINRSTVSLLAYEFNKINQQDAECFWNRLSNGVSTTIDDPILLLHKRLLDRALSKTNKIPKIVEAALIIKAWNFYITGESTKQLKYTSGGAKPEGFPAIYNPYENA